MMLCPVLIFIPKALHLQSLTIIIYYFVVSSHYNLLSKTPESHNSMQSDESSSSRGKLMYLRGKISILEKKSGGFEKSIEGCDDFKVPVKKWLSDSKGK